MELHGLGELAARGDPEPLRVHARRIALEAHAKLGGWRQLAVDELLATVKDPASVKDPSSVPVLCRVTESHEVLTENFANTYQVLRAQRWQVGVLAAAAIAALVAWWVGVGPSVLADGVRSVNTAGGVAAVRFPPGLLPSILLFGVLGAAVSGIASLLRNEPTTIPKQLMAWTGSLARIVVGAVSALVIFLALESTVIDVADSRLILLQSFAAGFSERLLSAAVKKAGG